MTEGEYWYDDGSLHGDRKKDRLQATCGCSACDEAYQGKGMLQKLKKHAREKHNEKIEIDGYEVLKVEKGDELSEDEETRKAVGTAQRLRRGLSGGSSRPSFMPPGNRTPQPQPPVLSLLNMGGNDILRKRLALGRAKYGFGLAKKKKPPKFL